jgi:hypothetical protein
LLPASVSNRYVKQGTAAREGSLLKQQARCRARMKKAMFTPPFSSSSVVSLILFGMLFAWLLISAAMTYRAGVPRRRVRPGEPPVSSAMATSPTVDETLKPMTDDTPPFPLSRGRRVDQHVGPETASIAASIDSR